MNEKELKAIKMVVHEAELAVNNRNRLITDSNLNKQLLNISALNLGTNLSLTSLLALGSDGLAKAGTITSDLSGGLIPPEIAGAINLSMPILTLGLAANQTAKHINHQISLDESKRLLRIAKKDYESISLEIEKQSSNPERIRYLKSLNILLHKAIDSLSLETK